MKKPNIESPTLSSTAIDQIVVEAQKIAAGDYKEHEPTARNHAALQAKIIEVNGELIKTIRLLDAKNSKLQLYLAWLALVATAASLIALLK